MKIEELLQFITTATRATYIGGGKREDTPERPGFTEMVFKEGSFTYRDSWTGYFRSRGMELVRYKGEPVWSCLYGGGMVEGEEALAKKCFAFLKKAMGAKALQSESARGPENFSEGDWSYSYQQEGDKTEFSGHEEINYKGRLVFFHQIIGGLIKDQVQT